MQKPFSQFSLCPSLTYMNKLCLGLFISEKQWGIFSKYSNTATSARFILMENPPWSGGQTPSEWTFGSDTLSEQLDTSIYTKNLGKGQQKWRNWGAEKLLTIPLTGKRENNRELATFSNMWVLIHVGPTVLILRNILPTPPAAQWRRSLIPLQCY